jgi:hypothetical protein
LQTEGEVVIIFIDSFNIIWLTTWARNWADFYTPISHASMGV